MNGTTKYLLAEAGFNRGYLGFGAQVIAEAGRYAVIAVAEEHAEWLLGRLMSGLVAGSLTIHDSPASARQEALDLSR